MTDSLPLKSKGGVGLHRNGSTNAPSYLANDRDHTTGSNRKSLVRLLLIGIEKIPRSGQNHGGQCQESDQVGYGHQAVKRI